MSEPVPPAPPPEEPPSPPERAQPPTQVQPPLEVTPPVQVTPPAPLYQPPTQVQPPVQPPPPGRYSAPTYGPPPWTPAQPPPDPTSGLAAPSYGAVSSAYGPSDPTSGPAAPAYGTPPDPMASYPAPPAWLRQSPAAPPPYGYPPPAYGQPPSPYGPMVMPPRRHLRTSMLVLITAGLAVLVMALSIGAIVFVHRRLAASADVTVSAAPTSEGPGAYSSAFKGDLRTLLLARPSGAEKLSFDGWASDGTVSARQEASRTSDPPSVLAWLQDELGYKQGAWTAWKDASGNQVLIVLHQFGGPYGASTWVSNNQQGLTLSFAPGGAIAGIPNGQYFLSKAPLEDGNSYLTGYFSGKDLVAEVSVFAKIQPTPEQFIEVAQQQFAKFP